MGGAGLGRKITRMLSLGCQVALSGGGWKAVGRGTLESVGGNTVR